jgi:hypothetical protein
MKERRNFFLPPLNNIIINEIFHREKFFSTRQKVALDVGENRVKNCAKRKTG